MASLKIMMILAAVCGTAWSYNVLDKGSRTPFGPMPFPFPIPDPGHIMPFPNPAGSMESCYFGEDQMSWTEGGANDMVVVGGYGEMRSTQFNVKLPRMRSWGPRKLYVNDKFVSLESKIDVTPKGSIFFNRQPNTCRFTSMELSSMNLMPGRNRAWLKIEKPWMEIWLKDVIIPFSIYYYPEGSRFVAFDIDNPMGEMDKYGYNMENYELNENRPEAVEMLDRIYRNGYTPVYITSRPYTQSKDVRYHLFEAMRDLNGFSLPMGPLFMAPRAFNGGMTRMYKTMQLINFANLFREPRAVFQGAYGHMSMDMEVYSDAGIDQGNIYLRDNEGRMYNMATREETSYRLQCDMVDMTYPRFDPFHPEPYNPDPYNPDVDPYHPDPYNPDVDPYHPDPYNPDVDPFHPDPYNPDVDPINPPDVQPRKLFAMLMAQYARL